MEKQRLTGKKIMEQMAERASQQAKLIVKAILVGGPPSLDGKRLELPCAAIGLPFNEAGVCKTAVYWPMPHDRKGDEIPFVFREVSKC